MTVQVLLTKMITQITLVQSDIDAARVTLDAEAAAVKYKTDRTTNGSTTYAP